MNYRAIYTSLVFSARAKHRIKSSEEYFEEHHIFPRSLFPEYKRNKHNLVLLTAREHYIAHKLLCKIWPSRSMYAAIWQMSMKSKKADSPYRKIVSAREYEHAKKLFVAELKANHWGMDFVEFNKRPERRARSSEVAKENWNNQKFRSKMLDMVKQKIWSKVRCITTGQVFDSINEAKRYFNIKAFHISTVCQGKRKYCGVDPKTGEKLQWEYVGTSERNQIYKNRGFTKFRGLENS